MYINLAFRLRYMYPIRTINTVPRLFQIVFIAFVLLGCAYAAPKPKADAFIAAAPLVAAPAVVTASSSQVIARNYNGLAAAPLVAAPAAVAAPLAAAPVFATPYAASYAAYPAYSPYFPYF